MPQPPCPQCQSTKYYKHSNGTLFCEFGHQNLEYIETNADDDVVYNRVRRIGNPAHRESATNDRNNKSIRPKTNLQRNQASSNLVEKHRTYILAQILQATLNDQAHALCAMFDLPPIFPDLCRDLWLLYLQSLNFDYTVTDPRAIDDPVNSNDSVESDSSRTGAITSTEIIEFDIEDALDTSDDDDDDSLDYVTYPFQMRQSTQVHKSKRPRFSFHYLPCFLYVACLHLSIPLCVADIHRLCVSEKLPYGKNLQSLIKYKMDFPSNINLDKFSQLRGNKVIPTTTMRRHVTFISNQLMTTYKLTTLPLNHVPLFIRWANEWGLGLRFAFTASQLMDVFKQTHSVFIDELIIGSVALKSAQLLTLANLIPKQRRSPVYPVTPINPPLTSPAMEQWASEDPDQFVSYVCGTRFISSEPINKYKDMYHTLNDLLLVDQPVSTSDPRGDVIPDGTTFPLGFQESLPTVVDISDDRWDQYLWHCVLSAMRCSRDELGAVYQYVSTELQNALPPE